MRNRKIMKIKIIALFLLLCSKISSGQSKSDFSTLDTAQRIEYLKTFAKIYGYVKYFHPSDEAAQIIGINSLYMAHKK